MVVACFVAVQSSSRVFLRCIVLYIIPGWHLYENETKPGVLVDDLIYLFVDYGCLHRIVYRGRLFSFISGFCCFLLCCHIFITMYVLRQYSVRE